MHKKRPVNLNLFTIKFPIPAIVSILHRVSGVILFLALPISVWIFSRSLSSEQHFNEVHALLTQKWMKFLIWAFLAPFCFHFVAGIRHLLMDVHVGETLAGGRLTAWMTMIISILLVILLGVWL